MDFLFGESQNGLRVLLAFLVVAILIGMFGWLVRRFGSERLGAASTRGRQPRLAVIDAATVDGRRRLILIRRDNVEHLLMIGGPTDLVVEPNIVRATPARELGPSRATAATDSVPRAAPSADAIWPATPAEPAPAPPPAPRPPRQPPAAEESAARRADAEPVVPAMRQPRPGDPLAGLAAELSRQPPPPIAPRPARERETAQEPLRRGPKPDTAAESKPLAAPEPRQKPVQTAAVAPPADSEPQPEAEVGRESALTAAVAAETRPAYTEAKPAREGKPAAPKPSSVYDSLEQEMANLLGRPNKS